MKNRMKTTKEERNLWDFSMTDLEQGARSRQTGTLDLLRRLVEVESPSADKNGVDRCMQLAVGGLRGRLEARSAGIGRRGYGDVLEVLFPAERERCLPLENDRCCFLGHLWTRCGLWGTPGEDAVHRQGSGQGLRAGSLRHEGRESRWRFRPCEFSKSATSADATGGACC